MYGTNVDCSNPIQSTNVQHGGHLRVLQYTVCVNHIYIQQCHIAGELSLKLGAHGAHYCKATPHNSDVYNQESKNVADAYRTNTAASVVMSSVRKMPMTIEDTATLEPDVARGRMPQQKNQP